MNLSKTKQTKYNIYNTIVTNEVMNAAESWRYGEADKKGLNVFEMGTLLAISRIDIVICFARVSDGFFEYSNL